MAAPSLEVLGIAPDDDPMIMLARNLILLRNDGPLAALRSEGVRRAVAYRATGCSDLEALEAATRDTLRAFEAGLDEAFIEGDERSRSMRDFEVGLAESLERIREDESGAAGL